jgi:hypothetical protein
MHGRDEKFMQHLKGRDHFVHLDIDGRLIVEWAGASFTGDKAARA